jgi:hypothetical protein
MYLLNKNEKIKFFSIHTGFIFIWWYKHYHLSHEATTDREIFVSIPLDENEYCIKLEHPLYPSDSKFRNTSLLRKSATEIVSA